MQARRRVIPVWSMRLETNASRIETEDVSAANRTITKKTIPINVPIPPMAPNTFGSVTNIRLGPADMPSVPRNAYTVGTIIIPARNATSESKISIRPMD